MTRLALAVVILIAAPISACDQSPKKPQVVDTTLPDEPGTKTANQVAAKDVLEPSIDADLRRATRSRRNAEMAIEEAADRLEASAVRDELAPYSPPPEPAGPRQVAERGNSANWITSDDYPSRALREGRGGVSFIGWDVDTNGLVVNCRVIDSSGSPDLDEAACRNITRRGRYRPASDAQGNAIPSTGHSRRVRWNPPQEDVTPTQ